MRIFLALVLTCELAVVCAAQEMPRAVDERLRIELFAAEPQIVTPTSLAVDDRGRVLVIECHTHMRPQNYVGPPADRVRIFEDTDGDGRADRISTFFEGTRWTMGLAIDRQGRVYVATRDEVFRLRDTDGDGQADERTPIVQAHTKADYPHNGLSGLAFDFAGNLYVSMGENLGQPYELVGSDGSTVRGNQGGHVFRCTADGARLERYATGFWNPFHIAVDPFGRLFAVDNDPHSHPPCRLLEVVPGGDYGYKYRNGAHGLHPFTGWNGETPGSLPMAAPLGEAPSGIVTYQSDALPADYQGELLTTSWGDHRLERVRLEPHGAAWSGQPKTFVAGGENFRPVGIAVAPDGSLFVSDWVDKAYEVHGKGRIWHITAAAAKPATAAAKADSPVGTVGREPGTQKPYFAAGALSDEKLKTILNDKTHDARIRAAAMTALGAAGGFDAIADFLRSPQPPVELAQYAWSIVKERGPTADDWRLRADQPAETRAAALRWTSGAHLPQLWTAAEDDDPFIAQAARLAIGRLKVVNGDFDVSRLPPRQRLAALLVLRETGQAPGHLLRASLGDADPRVRFAALQWIGEDELSDYRGELEKVLTAGPMSAELFAAYVATLEKFGETQRPTKEEWKPEQYVAQALTNPQSPDEVRRWALRVLRPDYPLLTVDFLRRAIDSDDVELAREAVRSLAASPHVERLALLAEIARDPRRPATLRADATAGLAPDQADLLIELVRGDQPLVRHEALRSLVGASLDDRQRALLQSASYDDSDPRILPLLARVLEPATVADRPPADDLEAWIRLLEGSADADEGERVFHSRITGCARCHTVEGRGGRIGPDLSAVGRALDRRRLIESILRPSKEIAPQYVTWAIETTDGKSLSGLLVGEAADGTQTYVDARGESFSLPAGSIEQRSLQTRSLMPDGLERLLTIEEFRDLLAFLKPLDPPSTKP